MRGTRMTFCASLALSTASTTRISTPWSVPTRTRALMSLGKQEPP